MSNWSIINGASTFDLQTNLGFKVTQQPGTGMAGVDNISTPFGLLDGELYQRTRTPARTFSLVGTIQGSSVGDLHRVRSNLINQLKPDRSASQLPVIIRYAGASTTKQASVFYNGGMELGTVEGRIENKLALQFWQPDPYWEATTSSSATLTTQTTVSNANYIVQRAACGTWGAMGTGMNAGVFDIEESVNGTYYVSGCFTTAGGTTACRVASYTNGSWSAVGNAMNNSVYDLQFGSDNTTLYAAGLFTTASAITVNYIAAWTGTAWQAVGGGLGNHAKAMTLDNTGNLVVGGTFITASGTSIAASRIAKWNGTTWLAYDGGLGTLGTVEGLAISNNYLYAVGSFTRAGTGMSTVTNYVARWDLSSSGWSAPGTSGSTIYNTACKVSIGFDDTVYIGGTFANSDENISRVAKWNGSRWDGMNGGVNAQVYRVTTAKNGDIYIGGRFSTAGSVSFPDSVSRWNGSVWTPIDINLSGSPNVAAIHSGSTGILTIGFDTAGTASAAAVTTVTNNGTSNIFPILSCSAPTSASARLYQMVNYTTGDMIFFNVTLAPSEVVTLNLASGKKTFTSNIRGNLISKILPGSNLTTWKLIPGANNISFG